MAKIAFSLTGGRHQLLSDLTEPEIYAIGYVTVNWAILEHLMLGETMALADRAKIPPPEDTTALSFKKRVRAWRSLIRKTVTPETTQKKMLNLVDRVSRIAVSRNRITHGLWDWELGKPEKLGSSSFRPMLEFEESFDLAKLIKIGDRISEINFQILYPLGKPQALQEIFEDATQRGGLVSREFLLAVTGKGPLSPHLPPPSPPKHKPPRSRKAKPPSS